MHGRYKMTVRKATRIQLGMTQAASGINHESVLVHSVFFFFEKGNKGEKGPDLLHAA